MTNTCRNLLSAMTLATAVLASGCAHHPRVVDTVPAWKGIPLMLIAPSSLEAQVWADYFHQRKHDTSAACEVDEPMWTMAANSSEEEIVQESVAR